MEREPVPSGARELPWGKTPSRSPSPSVSLLCHSTAAETPARAPTKIPEGQIHKETFRDNHGYRKLRHKHGAIHPNPFIRSWPPIPGHPQHSIPSGSLVPQFPLPQSGSAGSGTSLASCLSFPLHKAGMLGLAHPWPRASVSPPTKRECWAHSQPGWHIPGRAAPSSTDLLPSSRTFCSTYLTQHLFVCLKPGMFPLGQAGHTQGMFAGDTNRCSVHPWRSPDPLFPAAKSTLESCHVWLCPLFPHPSGRAGDRQEKGDIVPSWKQQQHPGSRALWLPQSWMFAYVKNI